MKRKFPVFYIVLISVSAVFLTALAVFLSFVRSYLAEYEASQPYNVVDGVLETYFYADDKAELLEKSGFEIPRFTTEAYLTDYLDEIFDGTLTYYSLSPSDGADLSYAVVAGDLKVAVIDLEECLDKTPRGFTQYMLSGIKLTIGAENAVNIKAPSDATVFINGTVVTSDYLSGEVWETSSCEHMPEGVSGITYVTYLVNGLFGEPDITARSAAGYSLDVNKIDDDGVFIEIPVTYPEIPEDLAKTVTDASEQYAAYMQKDATFNSVAKYVEWGSNLYTDLLTSDTRWVNEHTGYRIENLKLSEYYTYDENTFSCRVSFTHVLYGGWGGDYENEFDMTFYFRLSGGEWLIYDSQVN